MDPKPFPFWPLKRGQPVKKKQEQGRFFSHLIFNMGWAPDTTHLRYRVCHNLCYKASFHPFTFTIFPSLSQSNSLNTENSIFSCVVRELSSEARFKGSPLNRADSVTWFVFGMIVKIVLTGINFVVPYARVTQREKKVAVSGNKKRNGPSGPPWCAPRYITRQKLLN